MVVLSVVEDVVVVPLSVAVEVADVASVEVVSSVAVVVAEVVADVVSSAVSVAVEAVVDSFVDVV